jgi:hypothetical protein
MSKSVKAGAGAGDSAWENVAKADMLPEGQKKVEAVLTAMGVLEDYMTAGGIEVGRLKPDQMFRFSYLKLKSKGEVGVLVVDKPKPKTPEKAATATAKTKKWC